MLERSAPRTLSKAGRKVAKGSASKLATSSDKTRLARLAAPLREPKNVRAQAGSKLPVATDGVGNGDAGGARGAVAADRLTHLYSRPGIMLRRCHQITTALFDQAMGDISLTSPQYGAMVILREYPGVNQMTLGRLLGYDRSTIGNIISHLVDRGLVERKPDVIDKRGRILTLTAAADEAIRAGDRASQQAQKMLLAPLTAKQRSALVDALDAILDAYNSTTRAPLHSEAPDVQKKD